MRAVAVCSVAIVIKLIRLHRIRSIRMRHIATEGAAWSVWLSVCLLSQLSVSPAKTAEPIEIPLWMWTQGGTRNYHENIDYTPYISYALQWIGIFTPRPNCPFSWEEDLGLHLTSTRVHKLHPNLFSRASTVCGRDQHTQTPRHRPRNIGTMAALCILCKRCGILIISRADISRKRKLSCAYLV